MESGRTMVLHALVIGVVAYFIMTQLLNQRPAVAEDRSVLLAAVVLAYMVVFGHELPNRINPNIW